MYLSDDHQNFEQIFGYWLADFLNLQNFSETTKGF